MYDGTPGDVRLDAHGTHVAGTIGACGGNAAGVVGLNWTVTIIAAKFLGPSFGLTSDAVLAVNYITDLKNRYGLDVVVTNNSWTGGGYSTALHQANLRAAKNDILFVAAAGNNAQDYDTSPRYPAGYDTRISAGSEGAASYDAVISVAAITSGGALASFSNYGATTVDVGAPGVEIYSTTPQQTYAAGNGTSMAVPHVTGAVAMYRALYPSASAAEIRAATLNHAIPTSSLTGRTATGRRLNVGDFVGSRSTFTDSPLIAGVREMRAVHIEELRDRITLLRVAHGLTRFAWTDPVLTGVVARTVHLLELRTALDGVYAAAARRPPAYTDATLAPGVSPIRAVHIVELRAAVEALEP